MNSIVIVISYCCYRVSYNDISTGACEKTLPLQEPFPCNAAAETALTPPTWS